MPSLSWVRLRKSLRGAGRTQPPQSAADATAQPVHPSSQPPGLNPNSDPVPQQAELVQALHRRLAAQDAALLHAKAALAVEIRERQTAEQELQRAMEQERFAVAGRLAASVAHEINTPLQTLQTSLELLRALPPAEQDLLLADAIDEIQRIGRIVRQLLDLYRPAAIGAVDLLALVERVLLLLGKRMDDQHVTVAWEVATELPAHGRADELTQVVLNLVVNALDAMPAGGLLSFRLADAEDTPGHIILAVSDTGSGVRPELREHIFDPFVTTKPGGTGLGLAISRQIVERHGGKLTLAAGGANGSTFRVQLPVSAVEVVLTN